MIWAARIFRFWAKQPPHPYLKVIWDFEMLSASFSPRTILRLYSICTVFVDIYKILYSMQNWAHNTLVSQIMRVMQVHDSFELYILCDPCSDGCVTQFLHIWFGVKHSDMMRHTLCWASMSLLILLRIRPSFCLRSKRIFASDCTRSSLLHSGNSYNSRVEVQKLPSAGELSDPMKKLYLWVRSK